MGSFIRTDWPHSVELFDGAQSAKFLACITFWHALNFLADSLMSAIQKMAHISCFIIEQYYFQVQHTQTRIWMKFSV